MAGLTTYRGKRDFTRTPEPGPDARARRGAAPIFVVQEHAARRLHWDFRLEHGGVLWSFAVPKGPSMDPADKRLAVHVEDHPIDYAKFEGVIPDGNYGAGTVKLWDSGTWAPEGDADAGLAKGELKFRLEGNRLKGRFVLVRLKPRPKEKAENWLLIKEKSDDLPEAGPLARVPEPAPAKQRAPKSKAQTWQAPEGAKRAGLPASQAPMLASNADAPPDGGEWLSEIKFDGYRLLVFKDGDSVRLITRNGLDWTHRFPSIARAIAALPAQTLLLDGELVALRPEGHSSFSDLQAALSDGDDASLSFYVFDLLYRDGFDLRSLALTERKAALRGFIGEAGTLRLSDHLEGITDRIRQQACAMGLEGIICKRADSPYRAGRSKAWLKLKCLGREEFLVLGWTPPQGSRKGLGALHLGFYDPQGALHYAGGCGSGFSDATLGDLSKRLDKLLADAPAGLLLTDEKPPANLHWVKPELVVEVQYTAWSGAGRLRHPVFLGLREDKSPQEVVRTIPDPDAPRHALSVHGSAARTPPGRIVHARKPAGRSARIGDVEITHPERVLWPAGHGPPITKQDLAEYWRLVARTALPGIAGRPLALVRCPDGIEGEHFFQKHANKGMNPALREASFDGAPYLLLEDETGLLACAQMAAIELHGWGSTLKNPGRPDQLVFDLDPGDEVSFAQVVKAAHDIRRRLQDEGLETFCRTSGGKGLHLVAPLRPKAVWDEARAWCRAFAERCEQDAPGLYVATIPKARRRGKILIDWLRNGLGSTAVVSFSPRARPDGTVATPLAWSEVTPRLDPGKFTLRTVPARLAKLKQDPWHGFAATDQILPGSSEGKRKRA